MPDQLDSRVSDKHLTPTLEIVEIMAKQNSSATRRIQSPIPEAHRPQVKASDDGEWIFATIKLARYCTHMIRKDTPKIVDRAKIRPDRFAEAYEYGEGRKLRDGAETKDEKGNTLSAKVKKQATQLLVNALAHADSRIEWLYGLRDGKQKSVTVSTETNECRKRLIKFCIKNLGMTAKSVPSNLVRARSVSEAQTAAKAAGVPEKKVAAITKTAVKLAALIDDDKDMSIEV